MRTIIILGAPDPEMDAIEALCRAAGVTVLYATHGGAPVHSSVAYETDGLSGPLPAGGPSLILAVECDGPAIPATALRCDHHRPGDAGYGRPPDDFLPASSIGQVIAHLAAADAIPEGWARCHVPGDYYTSRGDISYGIGWAVRTACGQSGDLLDEPSIDGEIAVIPTDIVYAAAADHCLAAAYRGECLGVDPDDLMRWRVVTRAMFQRRHDDDVLQDIEAARARLRQMLESSQRCWDDAAERVFGWVESCDRGPIGLRDEVVARYGERPSASSFVADFGSQPPPELPEAACREGIAFVATVPDRDGRHKRVLQAASPQQVRDWLAEHASTLTHCYGDPARGFAGGYLPEPQE